MFQRDFICFAFPPRHPIRTSAAASGDEARPRLFGAKKRLSAMYEGAKQRSVIVGEDGVERVDEREEDGGREGGSYVAGKKGAERW